MPGHRNAISFPKTRTINYTVNINKGSHQPRVPRGGGGSIFSGMMGMNMLGGLNMLGGMFNMFTPLMGMGMNPMMGMRQQQPRSGQPEGNDEIKNLQQLFPDCQFSKVGNLYVAVRNGEKISANSPEELFTKLNEPVKTDGTKKEAGTGVDGGGKKYDLSRDPAQTETSYTIQKGDTWYGIALAKYDIPDGVNIKDVYRALAAANSGESDPTKAMEMAKKGIYFMPNQVIKLPEELTINGQKVKLKGDHANQNVAWKNTNFNGQGMTKLNIKITQVGEKWWVTENGERIGKSFNTKTDAEAKKAELENAQNKS